MTDTIAAITPCCGADWELHPVKLDSPKNNEILVKVVATGLCHTDLAVRDQHLPVPLPAVLGHEGAGIVVELGPNVVEFEVGDHVVLGVSSCGKCNTCISGQPCYCEAGVQHNLAGVRPDGSPSIWQDGKPISGSFFGQSSFAGYALASEVNAVKIPKDVPLELMGPLGCGIQTGAGTVMNELTPPPGSSIVIFGTGPVGLSAVMAAHLMGCTQIIAVDIHDNRLNLARELGATHVINSKNEEPVSLVRELTGGAQFTMDTTAIPAVIRQAVESLRPTGRCVFVGVSPPDAELTFNVNTLFFGQSVGGAIEGSCVPKTFIPQLIELWRQGKFPFEKLVTFYDFEQINEAVADSVSGKTLKAILRIAKKE